jgi:hypothetical protein
MKCQLDGDFPGRENVAFEKAVTANLRLAVAGTEGDY